MSTPSEELKAGARRLFAEQTSGRMARLHGQGEQLVAELPTGRSTTTMTLVRRPGREGQRGLYFLRVWRVGPEDVRLPVTPALLFTAEALPRLAEAFAKALDMEIEWERFGPRQQPETHPASEAGAGPSEPLSADTREG